MAKSRLEMQTDDDAEAEAERARFEELADQYRSQSHLPPQDDQSWREREAIRRAAYDKGYTPPQNDQSWRDREALLFAPSPGGGTVDGNREIPEQILRPMSVAKGGQGGIILLFILVAAIALGIAALAYPEILTVAYWTRQSGSMSQPPAPRAIQPVTTRPAAPPMKQLPPVPDLKRIPAEPPAEEMPPPSVPVIDARPPAKPLPAPQVKSRANNEEDRPGFYAKVPGPDGVMRDMFFPADPAPGAQKPAPTQSAVSDSGGFYAKAPGPDGTLELRYFPRQPPRR